MKNFKKVGILISINPPYTDMILLGCKPMEYRRKVLSSMITNIAEKLPLYLYETKNKGGIGKVVGEAKCLRVYRVYYGEPDKFSYAAARDACLKELYYDWESKHKDELSAQQLLVSEPWNNLSVFKQYCESIGWTDAPDFNYALCLSDVKAYENERLLSEFLNKDGNPIKRPPQNMCYVYREEE